MVLYNMAAGKGDRGRQKMTLDADFPEVHSVSSPAVSRRKSRIWILACGGFLNLDSAIQMIASEHPTWPRSWSDGDFGFCEKSSVSRFTACCPIGYTPQTLVRLPLMQPLNCRRSEVGENRRILAPIVESTVYLDGAVDIHIHHT